MSTPAIDRQQIVPFMYHDGYRTLDQLDQVLKRPDALEYEKLQMDDGKLHVVFFAIDCQGCGFYRAHQPARLLQGSQYLVAYPTNILTSTLTEWADIIVWERSAAYQAPDIIRRLRSEGKVSIYDIDDDVFNIPAHNPAAPIIGVVEHQEKFSAVMHAVDYIFTPNGALATKFGERFEKRTFVVPNVVHLPDFVPMENDTGKLRIGWAGGTSHKRDIAMIRDALKDASKDATIVIMGFDGIDEAGNVFDGIDIEYHKPVPPHAYAAHLSALKLDIGLAPLEENGFNLMKSPIKVEEYGALGIPVVASKVGPYKVIEHGVTGLHASNGGDFRVKLRRLIRDEKLRTTLGTNLKSLVQQRFSTEAIMPQLEALLLRLAP